MCRANLIPVHPICSDLGQFFFKKPINNGLAPPYELLTLTFSAYVAYIYMSSYIAVWFQSHIGKMGFNQMDLSR